MSDIDLNDYEVMSPGESGDEASDRESETGNATYQEWDVMSSRTYPSVTIAEYSAVDDEDAEQYYAENPEHFAHDVSVAVHNTNAQSVNFRVTAIDLETGQQVDVVLRMDTDPESMAELSSCIRDSVALPYMSAGEGSDTVSDRRIIWKLDWFQLITQLESAGVTVVIGSAVMFPGYRTRVIDTHDHGVVYSSADCLFMCLNEVMHQRHAPARLRAQLLGTGKDCAMPISTRKDFVKIAEYYKCRISIHSLDDGTKSVTSSDATLPLLKLVKMGSAIGIIESKSTAVIESPSAGIPLHMYYDFETVSDSDVTSVYGFSAILPDGKRVTLIHSSHKLLAKSIRSYLKRFLRSLNSVTDTVYMHAWNGSAFDHLILMRMCNEKFKVSSAVMNSHREVLTASLHCGGKTLVLRDPCKMFSCSLDEAAKLFDIPQGKLHIDHSAVEEAFIEKRLGEYLRLNYDQVLSYVERDVDVLKGVTERIMRLYEESGIKYNSCYTRSMASLSMWKGGLSAEARLGVSSLQFSYGDLIGFAHRTMGMEQIRDHCIAGRVQGIPGHHRHVTLLDFRSMYPSVASTGTYPSGDYAAVSQYTPGKLGLYLVDIVEQVHPHVVPHRRSAADTYDWSYRGRFTKLLTSVDVQCLEESGAVYHVLDGIVWESSANYFSEHMTEMFERRDKHRMMGDDTMSKHYKHMANSLTGAIFQQLRREYVKVFATKHDADMYMKMYGRYVKMTQELAHDAGQVMLFFYPKKVAPQDMSMQRQICRGAVGSKPVILTMFIYAYARAKLWRMWKHVESSNVGTVVYCDTDSLAVAASSLGDKRLVNVGLRLREFTGNAMGDLEVVVHNADMVVVSPKVYAMRTRDRVERVRVKGVSRKSRLYLLEPGSEMHKSCRDSARQLHKGLEDVPQVELCYDTVEKVLRGYALVSAYWYFAKAKGVVHKRYSVRVVQCR